MDMKKIGCFLRQLRMEQNLTQEQLAEKLNVSRRTVSRWETGSNMPDVDILIELADDYGLDLREILEGERKPRIGETPVNETARQIADYSKADQKKLLRRMNGIFLVGSVSVLVYTLTVCFGPESLPPALRFLEGLSLGFAAGCVFLGAFMTSGYMEKVHRMKLELVKKVGGKDEK